MTAAGAGRGPHPQRGQPTDEYARERFGFTPRWTTQQAFDDFVRGRDLHPVIDPDRVTAWERGVGDLLARLR